MTVTIHWTDDRAGLVRALTALAGGRVRAVGAGVVVPDEVARRWLAAAEHGDGPVAEAATRTVVDDVVVEVWAPPPPAAANGNGTPRRRSPASGLNRPQRKALDALRSGDPDAVARIHAMTLAALRRRGLVPDHASSEEQP